MNKLDQYNFFSLYIKNDSNNLLSKKQRDDFKYSKKLLRNNKEVLRERERERAKNKFRELSEEEKNIKREYGRNRYHNMSEEDKQRLKEYQINYREAKKST